MKESKQTLAETSYQTGLSSTSRLHDLFIKIEGMSPAEYKNGGKNLMINYSFSDTPFGAVIVASTTIGICYLAFIKNEQLAITDLQMYLPHATFIKIQDEMQQNALSIFSKDWTQINQIKLHLKGTDFQLKVWQALLNIPLGNLESYGNIANKIKVPNASRAVGTAIGNNPVAFLIPCHRVIQSTGLFGQYMWGATRKTAIIGWEASEINK